MSSCDLEEQLKQEVQLSRSQRHAETVHQDKGDESGLDFPPAALVTEEASRFKLWGATHQQTYQVLWHVDIMPFPEMPLLLCPLSIGVQATSDRRYQAEGRWRPEQDYCYFCYTLDGVGGFSDRQGVHQLSEGDCFLIEIADPSTRYFYPAVDGRPWRFLAFNFRGLAARAMVRELAGSTAAFIGWGYSLP